MASKLKICNECGKKVGVNSNFCPYCKSESFKNMETMEDLKYKLLYWQFDNGFILSKTKVITIGIFLACVIDWFIDMEFAIFGDVVLAIVIFAVGFVLHKILGNDKPSENVVMNNDNGLIDDFTHLLFYWQDKETGEYAVSKTKIISLILFYIVALSSVFTSPDANLMFAIGAGAVLGIPAFFVGYLIHRFTNK